MKRSIACIIGLMFLVPAASWTLDLSSRPQSEKTWSLTGPWEFYWQAFLSQSDLQETKATPVVTELSHRSWVSQPGLYPAMGFGTYRLHVKLPEREGPYGLYLGIIGASARVFWNDSLVAEYGSPATSPEAYVPGWKSEPIPLPPGTEGDIIVQVANYDDMATSGFRDQALIGQLSEIQRASEIQTGIATFVSGFCLSLAILHLLFLIFRRGQRANLYLALICIVIGIRVLVSDSMPITVFWPTLGWRAMMIAGYLSYIILVMAFTLFITNLFRFKVTIWFRILAAIGCVAYTVLVLVTEVRTFTSFLFYFQIFNLVLSACMMGIFIAALVKRRDTALLFSLGFLVLIGTVVLDIVAVILRLNLPSFSQYGIVVFVVLEALVVAKRSHQIKKIAESLAQGLRHANEAQARFIPNEFIKLLATSLPSQMQAGDQASKAVAILVIASGKPLTLERALEFHTQVGHLVRQHNGFVERYETGFVRAMFPDQARAAIACAFDLIRSGSAGTLGNLGPLSLTSSIHFGEVRFGILGESHQLNLALLSDEARVAERMVELGQSFQVRVLVSKDALVRVGALEGYQFRRVGGIKIADGILPVYDFFDADPEPVWKAKRQTRRILARGLRFIALGRPLEANELLSQVLNQTPDDPVALYYRKLLGAKG